jgi:polar amino acid transport system permease protein
MVGQYYLERHYARGSVRSLPPTPTQRLRRWLLIRPQYDRASRSVGPEAVPVGYPHE